MRKLIVVFAILFPLFASSQTISGAIKSMQQRVDIDSLNIHSGRVVVHEHIGHIDETNSQDQQVNGYRIVIFMGNSTSARGEAIACRDNFSELFPDQRVALTYDNPYFKVIVGNCLSQEEAKVLLYKLRSHYPKAFIMRDNISIRDFRNQAILNKTPRRETQQ